MPQAKSCGSGSMRTRRRSGSGARISIETLRMLGRSMARNMPTSAAGLATFRRKIDVLGRAVKGRAAKQTPPEISGGVLADLMKFRGGDYRADFFFPLRGRC